MKLHRMKKYQFLIFTFLLIIAACKKDQVNNDFTLSRQFSVGAIRQTVTETAVRLEWAPSLFTQEGKVQYTVELAKDSLFTGVIELTKTVNVAEVRFIEGELLLAQNYFARIKANGVDGTADSKWIVSSRFRITGEQLLSNISPSDITATSVTIKWRIPSTVTHLTLGTARYDITPQELIAGQKTITGLTPLTAYTVSLFAGTSLKGSRNFTTLTDLPTGPNVVNVGPNDDLATLISNAANGTTFVLLQGTIYKSDVIVNIPNGTSITIFGQTGPNKPIIAFNGFNLPASAGVIKFENLDFTGFLDNDPTKTKRGYIFNQSIASSTQEILFTGCIIRNLANTPMRLQGSAAISIGRFTINNSIVFDIGDNGSNGTYAVVHNSVATGVISNIVLTNSTFYRFGYSLVLHGASPSTSVIVENNTLNNGIGNARYLIDFNAQTVGTFSFKNNILGKTFSPANTARGIRYGGANLVVDNSYQTSDATITSNLIPNISAYGQPSTTLFTNPDAGNFLIKDSGFAGKSSAGDPRWRL
jgi:hypothetical protein